MYNIYNNKQLIRMIKLLEVDYLEQNEAAEQKHNCRGQPIPHKLDETEIYLFI